MLEKFQEEKRKQQLITGVAIFLGVGGIFLFSTLFGDNKKEKDREEVAKVQVEDAKKIEEESFREVFGRKMVELEKKIKTLERENQNLKKKLEEKKKEAEKRKEDITRLFGKENNLPDSSSLPVPPPPPPPPPSSSLPLSSSGNTPSAQPKQVVELKDLIAMDVAKETGQDSEKAQKVEQNKRKGASKTVIPAGSFVKGVLLSGLDAPTAGKAIDNPHPVLIKITDEAYLPNLWKADIKECFVIGSSYGDLSSERAYIRLEVLSCVKEDGKAVERKINGYVAGEDGKVGLSGRVVSKQGQMLARALLAGFVEGVGRMFGQAGTTVVVSPQGGFTQSVNPSQAAQVGLAEGFSVAAKKLADFYMKLVNEMYPVVEINAGRKVDLVFLSKVDFEEEKE